MNFLILELQERLVIFHGENDFWIKPQTELAVIGYINYLRVFTLPNLVFTDENKFDIQQVVSQQNDRVWASSSSAEGRIVTRHQNSQCVMVWAAVTETGRSPLLFCPLGVKLNSQCYIADVLEVCWLAWAKKHFQGISWSLQQNSAPSNASKITQSSIQGKIALIISKEVWLASSPDLTLLNFSIWSFQETKVCSSLHPTVEVLRQNCWKSGSPSLRKWFVPPVPRSQSDWGP